MLLIEDSGTTESDVITLKYEVSSHLHTSAFSPCLKTHIHTGVRYSGEHLVLYLPKGLEESPLNYFLKYCGIVSWRNLPVKGRGNKS